LSRGPARRMPIENAAVNDSSIKQVSQR